MATLSDLADRLEAKARKIEQAASDIAIDAALAIVGNLVYATPVDTSQALSNWQVSIGSAITSKIDAYYPGEYGSTQRASAGEALAAAKAALKNKKPGEVIFIRNNVPYIRRLNDGYSKQAPAGFVERAALVGRVVVRNAKLKL